MDSEYIVEMRGISKSFGAIQALQNVDLELRRGEILGLVGDNAAGKSTLMKILAGAHVPDAGQILIEGRPVAIHDPQDARDLGISIVYQNLALFDNMDVAANIFLTRELKSNGLLDVQSMREATRQLLNDLKIDITSPDLLVANMSGGQRQMVACARAMAFESRIILLDEPTAALGVKEANTLLNLVRSWKEHGVSIILITQRVPDVLAIGDRVMVLKGGMRQGILDVDMVTLDDVVDLIVRGRDGTEQSDDQGSELDFLSFG